MPSRLRIFVKKRGTRRTGARWQGLLAESAVFLGFIALGAYGIYWLLARVLMAEDSSNGWWPWLAILIPLALVGYGAAGLVVLIWENMVSSERRAMVARRATEWELPGGTENLTGRAFPAVPPIDSVIDSAGVRLAYRLPIDSASGWISFTMATVCLVWNTLVAIFVVQVVRQHLAGEAPWLLTWLIVPFVLAGIWTLIALSRQVMRDILIGTTRVEVSNHPFYPGSAVRAFLTQTGRLHLRWLHVNLVCEEHAVYQQGTDTRRATSETYRATVYSERKFDITPQQPFESEFEFVVPPSAMHSFAAPHNAVMWTLVVQGRMARWGQFERRFPVYVYPPVPQPADLNLQPASAGEAAR